MDLTSILSGSMAANLHFISFGLLLLAGFNLPVSEDLVFIISASIAATVIPENTVLIFMGCFLGAYFSDIIAYLIGRHGVNYLLKMKFFNSESTQRKVATVEKYFNKYSGKTLFFGRFIPFGVRNILFITAGMVRMEPLRFLIIDFSALIITSVILFSVGYKFGQHIDHVKYYLDNYKVVVFAVFLVVIGFLLFKKLKNRPSE